jgi:maltooligosyltrehalose trehalohydrolase
VIDDPEIPRAGVHPLPDGRARWCVWAPGASKVELVLDPDEPQAARITMQRRARGFHEVEESDARPGRTYGYSLDGCPVLPDPRSRWQPDGVDRPSAIYYPEQFSWDERGWHGIARRDLVFYELHVGTFTPEGSFDAVIPRIGDLLELGVTAIELMPVAQFPGTRGWGYDGVFPFAPQHSYGGPQALQRLVEACHREGMAVFLDVVYNHFGPEGNVLPRYGPYFNDRYRTDWGPAVNYDGRSCDPVRALVLDNVRMWVRDYRFDGLRLDAADQIYDRSPSHILAEVAELAHAESQRLGRTCHLFAETDMNDAGRFVHATERGGYGLDGHWNDDFHHAAHVVLTGDSSGYFVDFADGPRSLAKVLERGFVNDGVYSPFRDRRHGAPVCDLSGDRFVAFFENHDQVANGNAAKRYAAVLAPAQTRLAAGILLLSPRLPLLFMGQEYGEDRDFPYFCDYQDPRLVEAVRRGRAAEFAHFGRTEEPADPVARTTRDAAVLSWEWDEPRRRALRQLYRDLLRLRRDLADLQDFAAPQAELAQNDSVLDVRRGRTRLLFNLCDEQRSWPDDARGCTVLFRSENENRPSVLEPFEFAVLEAPMPPARSSTSGRPANSAAEIAGDQGG